MADRSLTVDAGVIADRAAIDALFLTRNIDRLRFGGTAAELAAIGELPGVAPADQGDHALTRAAWNRLTPFLLETARLSVRQTGPDHAAAFHRMLSDPGIARMLVNLPHPITRAGADLWVAQRSFRGRAGFQLGILTRDDRLAGSIGISALSNALVYFLDRDARGHGYAQEVMKPFLSHVHARWRMPKLFAGVFQDNPASRRILEHAGFTVTGEGRTASPGRAEPAAFWEMELAFPEDRAKDDRPEG